MAAVLLSTACCTKFLTEDPKTFLTPDNYYVSEAQMQDAVNGLYPGIPGTYMAGLVAPQHTTFIMLETLTGYHKRNHAAQTRTLGYELPLSDDNGLLDNNWNGMYAVISRANEILDQLSDADIVDRAREIAGSSATTRKKIEKQDEVDRGQLSMSDTIRSDDIVREILELKVNQMSPLEALNELDRLQSKLKNRWNN
jgi:hypothetical protein